MHTTLDASASFTSRHTMASANTQQQVFSYVGVMNGGNGAWRRHAGATRYMSNPGHYFFSSALERFFSTCLITLTMVSESCAPENCRQKKVML